MHANFSFEFDSKEDARAIANSIEPEITHKIPKTKVDIILSENTINLKIETDDISSLRAACNSYLRWMATAQSVRNKI